MISRTYHIQNGKTRTLLLPMIYDFHQLIKATDILMLQNKPRFQKLHNVNSTQPELTNILISYYVPFIAEVMLQ
jgi:hypothetical protein